MSGKLDQPLDEIISSQRQSGGRRRTTRRNAGKPAATAPVGGVTKTRQTRAATAAKPAPTKAATAGGISKVVVSNLVSCLPLRSPSSAARLTSKQPKDVNEGMIKVCFR